MDDFINEGRSTRGKSENIRIIVDLYKSLNSEDPKQVFTAAKELKTLLSDSKKKSNK